FYGPKPHLDGFGLRMFSNDDAMIQAAKHGEIDAIEGGGGTIPPPSVKTLKGAGWIVDTGPGLTENDFIFNSNPKKAHNRELLDPSRSSRRTSPRWGCGCRSGRSIRARPSPPSRRPATPDI